ncbi:hypothetical protein O3P69_011418 [Scylla paramamosain]|uniref:Uncharacterized protein n=1 Tax=Scylla paramamosain TaxID=85552 RepID=A0AAW0T7V9_SCYPA
MIAATPSPPDENLCQVSVRSSCRWGDGNDSILPGKSLSCSDHATHKALYSRVQKGSPKGTIIPAGFTAPRGAVHAKGYISVQGRASTQPPNTLIYPPTINHYGTRTHAQPIPCSPCPSHPLEPAYTRLGLRASPGAGLTRCRSIQ